MAPLYQSHRLKSDNIWKLVIHKPYCLSWGKLYITITADPNRTHSSLTETSSYLPTWISQMSSSSKFYSQKRQKMSCLATIARGTFGGLKPKDTQVTTKLGCVVITRLFPYLCSVDWMSFTLQLFSITLLKFSQL